MNIVDIILIVLVLLACFIGYFKGFIYQLLTLVMLVAAYLLSPYTAMLVVKYTKGFDLIGEFYLYIMARIVTGAVIYYLLSIVVWYIDQKTISGGIKTSSINRMLGLALGLAKGVAIALIIVIGVSLIPQQRVAAVAPVVNRSIIVQKYRDWNPIPFEAIESNLSVVLSSLEDPEFTEKLVARLASRGYRVRQKVSDLARGGWSKHFSEPKFFQLLKDPKLFEGLRKTEKKPQKPPTS